MTNDELLQKIEDLERQVRMLQISPLSTQGDRSIITGDVTFQGQTALRLPIIYALTSGMTPTDPEANGVFMNAFGETFDGSTYYQLGGVNNGGLMFGLRSTDGAALFLGGQGIIDSSGINTRGMNYGLRQYAEDPTDSTTKRYFRMEMLLPDGRTQPAGSLVFMTGDETNLITNGDAETGDLSNWTQSGTLWSADSSEYHGGVYSFKFDNNLSTAETLTSDRYAASASKIYSISAWMKDYYDIVSDVKVDISADTDLDTCNATTPLGLQSAVWLGFQYPYSCKHHAIIKHDYSQIPSNLSSVVSSKIIHLWHDTSGDQTYNVYRCLRDWVEAEATWNVYSTGNNWGTAGAENTSTDRGSVSLGSSTQTEASTRYDISINTTTTKQMIDGTLPNYGFVIKGTTESGTTDRHGAWYSPKDSGVGSGSLWEFSGVGEITYIEASKYTVYMKWYDDASAGDLIRTDTLFTENNTNSWNERTATVTAPAGALSYEIVISGDKGREFWIDDIVVAEQTFANKLLFLPELSYQDADSTRRILSAKKELYAPLAPVIALVSTASGDCTNGAHLCKITFVDSSGETEASAASNSVTVDASHKKITCSLEVGPWGTTARNIYMTEAGGTTYKLVGTQADNTTTSYTIDVADGSLTTDAPAVNLSGSRNLFPTSFVCPAYPITSNASLAHVYAYGLGLPTTNQNGTGSANDGDYFIFPEFYCMGGEYTLTFTFQKGPNRGKFDIYIDNVLASSGNDGYNGSDLETAINSTNITISGNGTHTLKCVINGKNASSTDYFWMCCSAIGQRTGD